MGNNTVQRKVSGEERLKRTVHHIIALLLEDPEPPPPLHHMPLRGHQMEVPKDMVHVPKYPAPEMPKAHYPEHVHSSYQPHQIHHHPLLQPAPSPEYHKLPLEHYLSAPLDQMNSLSSGDPYLQPLKYDNPPPTEYFEPPPAKYMEPLPAQYSEPPPTEYSEPPPPQPEYSQPPPPPPPPEYSEPPPAQHYEPPPLPPLMFSDQSPPEHSEPLPLPPLTEHAIPQHPEQAKHMPSHFLDDDEENEDINPGSDYQGEIPAVFSDTGAGRKPSHPPENLLDLYPKMPGEGYQLFPKPNIQPGSLSAPHMEPQHQESYQPPVFEPEPIIHQAPAIPNPPPQTLNSIPHKAPFSSHTETLDKQMLYIEPQLYPQASFHNQAQVPDDYRTKNYEHFPQYAILDTSNIPNPGVQTHNEETHQLEINSAYLDQPHHDDSSFSQQPEFSDFTPQTANYLPSESLFSPHSEKPLELHIEGINSPFTDPIPKLPELLIDSPAVPNPPSHVLNLVPQKKPFTAEGSPVVIQHDNTAQHELFHTLMEQINSPNDALHIRYHDDAEDTYLDVAPKPSDPDDNRYPVMQVSQLSENPELLPQTSPRFHPQEHHIPHFSQQPESQHMESFAPMKDYVQHFQPHSDARPAIKDQIHNLHEESQQLPDYIEQGHGTSHQEQLPHVDHEPEMNFPRPNDYHLPEIHMSEPVMQQGLPQNEQYDHGTHLHQPEMHLLSTQHVDHEHETHLFHDEMQKEPVHHVQQESEVHLLHPEQEQIHAVELNSQESLPLHQPMKPSSVGGYEMKPLKSLIHVHSPHHPDGLVVQYNDDAEDVFLDFAPQPIDPDNQKPPLPDNQQQLLYVHNVDLHLSKPHENLNYELHQPQHEMQHGAMQPVHHEHGSHLPQSGMQPLPIQHIHDVHETQLSQPEIHLLPIQYDSYDSSNSGKHFENQHQLHFSKGPESSHNLSPPEMGSLKSPFPDTHHISEEPLGQPNGFLHELQPVSPIPYIQEDDMHHSEHLFGSSAAEQQSLPVKNEASLLLLHDQHHIHNDDMPHKPQAIPPFHPAPPHHPTPTLYPIPIPIHPYEHQQPIKLERPILEQYENEEHQYPRPIPPHIYESQAQHQGIPYHPIHHTAAVPIVILAEPMLNEKPHTHTEIKNPQISHLSSENHDEVKHDQLQHHEPNYIHSTHSGYSIHVDHPSPKPYKPTPQYESSYTEDNQEKPQPSSHGEQHKQVYKPDSTHHSGYEVHVQHENSYIQNTNEKPQFPLKDVSSSQQNLHHGDKHHGDYKANPILANGYSIHVQHEAQIRDPFPTDNYQQNPTQAGGYGSHDQDATQNAHQHQYQPPKEHSEQPAHQSGYEVHIDHGYRQQSQSKSEEIQPKQIMKYVKPSLHHLSYDINVQHEGNYNTNSGKKYGTQTTPTVQNPSYHVHMEQQIEQSHTPPSLYNSHQDNNHNEMHKEMYKPPFLPISNAGYDLHIEYARPIPVATSNLQYNPQNQHNTIVYHHHENKDTPKKVYHAATNPSNDVNKNTKYDLSSTLQPKAEDPLLHSMNNRELITIPKPAEYPQLDPRIPKQNPINEVESQFLSKPAIIVSQQPNMITSAYEILHQHDQFNEYRINQETSYQNDVTIYEGASIPGTPGIDYPVYSYQPPTNFKCDIKLPGFFADVNSRCQVWHYCELDGSQESFLCPNGTLFNQKHLNCDWWYNVECHEAEHYYQQNAQLYNEISHAHEQRSTKTQSSQILLKKSDIVTMSSLESLKNAKVP